MKDFTRLLPYLPRRIGDEVLRISAFYRGGITSLCELRLSSYSRSSVKLLSERIILHNRCTPDDIRKSTELLCEGAMYAKRDTLSEGFVTLFDGVRVGICGQARYDGGVLVGISEPSTLVFRIPTEPFFDPIGLYSAYKGCTRGMLVYSPPGVGKTTALRTLAGLIASPNSSEEVVVIDERCEFIHDDYSDASVAILRGYKRAEGMAIALRTLSPTVMMVDEIGRREEALMMTESLNSGVKVVATAHAGSLSELRERRPLFPFFECGIFDVFVGVGISDGERTLVVNGVDE